MASVLLWRKEIGLTQFGAASLLADWPRSLSLLERERGL